MFSIFSGKCGSSPAGAGWQKRRAQCRGRVAMEMKEGLGATMSRGAEPFRAAAGYRTVPPGAGTTVTGTE